MIPGTRPILLTGSHGQLGSEVLPLLGALGMVSAPARAELDLTNGDALRSLIRSVQPRWIINTAAYTAVDRAESEQETAFAVNREVPRILGEEAARLGAVVLHLSTDYVFSGEGTNPWHEEDLTGPLNVYGLSKLAGEQELAASGASFLTFRTSWVYGIQGNNFLKTILRVAPEREVLNIVDDQHGAPTWSRNLAYLLTHTMRRFEGKVAASGMTLAEAVLPDSGVYHACDAGFTTWFSFASEFLRLARLAHPEKPLATLHPVSTAEYPTPARRPLNSRLNCERFCRTFEFTMPTWQASTSAVMRRLLAG